MSNRNELELANGVRRAITTLARRLRKQRLDHGVSAARLSLLGRLLRAGKPMTATELARGERLQPQSLTRIIADLDERGLIRRQHDSIDRRQLLLEITPRGRDLLVVDASRQNEWLARTMASQLNDAERELLRFAAKLLERLAETESAGGDDDDDD
jgi:DNA-binding MarR family transcriptional regulator